MELQVALQTMTTFFLLLAVGFAAGKLGVIKGELMGQLGQIVTKLFLPAMIFYMTATTVTVELMAANIILIPAAAAVYALLALATFVLAKLLRLPADKDRVFQFCFIFGNTGFVGFPLLSTVFPETGIVFMCLFTIVDQLVFWTYGIWLSTARGSQAGGFNMRVLLSPNVLAIAASLIWVATGLSLPLQLDSALGAISRATSPLCMLYLGAMICFSKLGGILRRPELYVGIAVKMVALPLAACSLAAAAGLAPELAGCVALYVALPVMTVVPMICAQNGSEGPYATGVAVVTFVACVLTIPLVAYLVL